MANPPPNFGGNRQFLADPNATGLSTIVGDMAALQLQLINALEGAISPASRNVVDNIAEQVRAVLEASDICQAKELSTYELTPLTRLPAVEWGDRNDIANIRMHNIPPFTGTDSDDTGVILWMSRVLNLAQIHGLTFNAALNLMILGSIGRAADYIEQMKDEGKTLHQIVQLLEVRYGDLCSPEEARVKINNMVRKEDEILPHFVDRLRVMARMSCHLIEDKDVRRQATMMLVENNIRRVLPTSVRDSLDEMVRDRSQMGLPALPAGEIEKQCYNLEKQRLMTMFYLSM